MPIQDIIRDLISLVVGPVIAGFWSHLHLTRYGIFLLQRQSRGIHSYQREEDFWRDLIGSRFHSGGQQKLKLGDIIELRNFQLTEWFPRCPGTYWTEEGTRRRRHADEDIEGFIQGYRVLGLQGKYEMVSGGIGTNRTLSHNTPNGKYHILCATSSGMCDAGIPIVLVEDVAANVVTLIAEDQGVEVDIQGQLCELPFDPKEIIQSARGAELVDALRSWLSSALHVPRYFILVESSRQVKKYISDFSLKASAWALFGRESREGIIPSFRYATFDPRNNVSVDRATDFINEYIFTHGGKTIYTDFDEHVQRLDAKYPFSEIMDRRYDNKEADGDLKLLLDWGRTVRSVNPW